MLPNNNKLRKRTLFTSIIFFIVFIFLFCIIRLVNKYNAISSNIVLATVALHYPIYPRETDNVIFTLNKIDGNVKCVRLYETLKSIDSTGQVKDISKDSLLIEWKKPIFPLKFTRAKYGKNKLITYRFQVIGNVKSYNHRVTFATNPYPVKYSPIPVYVVGNRDKVLNCVFIPDNDLIDSIDLFYNSVGIDIDKAFHQDKLIRRLINSYNFFINPLSGTAGYYDSIFHLHQPPDNSDSISFADAKIILHKFEKRDFTDQNSYCGSEYYDTRVILHETGHALYKLYDEYEGATHKQWPNYPNNWSKESNALNATNLYGLSRKSIVQIDSYPPTWKICKHNCIMNNTNSIDYFYDLACQYRILYIICEKAKFNYGVPFYKSDNILLINKLNEFIEAENKKNLPLNYISKHIGIKIVIIDDKYYINNVTSRPGLFKINKTEIGDILITCKGKNGNLIGKYYIQDPTFINICDSKKGKIKISNIDFDLLIPFDENIQKIEVYDNKNNVIANLNLNINKYRELFK